MKTLDKKKKMKSYVNKKVNKVARALEARVVRSLKS